MFSIDDCIILPGGFSYGDYLRCGAIARFSPMMQSVIAFKFFVKVDYYREYCYKMPILSLYAKMFLSKMKTLRLSIKFLLRMGKAGIILAQKV